MTTIETATGCRITVGPKGLALWGRSAHLIGYELSTPLTADERRALVAALNPGQGGQWTRDDFARLDIHPMSFAGDVLDEVVAWLNAHHPKPQPYDQGGVRGVDSLLYRAERERDAAVARAEQAGARVRLANQQSVEWEGEAERLLCERDEWKARAEAAEQLIPAYAMLDIWMALGRDSIHFDDWYDEHGYADAWAELTSAVREAAEARTTPAVSRADVEECVYGSRRAGRECDEQGFVPVHVQEAVGQLCDLFGVEAEQAVDPVVHVVRESDLPAARVDGDYYVVASAKGDYKWPQHGPSWWAGRAQDALAEAARYTSLARLAADREATVDPVEEKAIELHQVAYGGRIGFGHATLNAQEMFRSLARHVLGQEADDE